ncbi:hypothetical protein RP20_CCG019996 [Aedes albopictus]|nr:hypothetical protein RP20_CCG019996 [Aedes albopictus]
MKLTDEQKQRKRTAVKMSPEVLESLVLLEKQWAKYRMEQKLQDYQLIDRVLAAQTKALNELRLESEELYQKALRVNEVPFKTVGPVVTLLIVRV